MTQFIIKDAHGKALQSLPRIASYARAARNMLSIDAQLPLSVWRHETISGAQTYDSDRTRRLSNAVKGAQS